MKSRKWIGLIIGICGWIGILHGSMARGQGLLPLSLLEISSITVKGTNVVVEVQVSAEFKSVTLEGRPRIDGGNWEPVAVQHLDEFTSQVEVITFVAPQSGLMELLRVRGETNEVVPKEFFEGVKSFSLDLNSGDAARVAGPEMGFVADGGKSLAPGADDRKVVESDIWKVDGDTLYFFNQYRGLQIIDVKTPDAPAVLGTFALPAAGEQMYLAGPNQVVLLARDLCGSGAKGPESKVLLLSVESGEPRLVAELPVAGTIVESRMVGSALYVVSQGSQTVEVVNEKGDKEPVWEWGSYLASFDLNNFAEPTAKETQRVPGSTHAIYATDKFLFVAKPERNQHVWNARSEIHVFDISAPDGSVQFQSSFVLAGYVKDKFKMHLDGDVFTAVTETWDQVLKTQVQTFSLADPKLPRKLGFLPIIEREQLFATRFTGKLLYAVTFLRVDPLWIIDLTDPANPQILGELEIPGWSTFLYPMEGKLLTVGIDNTEGWRTSVQLFDVSDPAKPFLASKVLIGEQSSSSEANQDEKAFGVIPEENLVLVPFSSWGPEGQKRGVQLIDLNEDTLVKRGVIDHAMQARRATSHRGRILSLSGMELLSVDATNRDQPRITGGTELSWFVDRVFVEGNFLVEIATPWDSEPMLRVVSTDATRQVLNRVKLGKLQLLGADKRDGKLFVAQGKSTELIWPRSWNPTNYVPVATNHAKLSVSVFDLSKLPELALLGETEQTFEGNRYWGKLEPIWPKDDVLVWKTASQGHYWLDWGWRGIPAVSSDAALAPEPGIIGKPFFSLWHGSSDAHLMAYDVSNASTPEFLSQVDLRGTNNWWNFSKAFTAQGLIFLSHQQSHFDPEKVPPPSVWETYDGKERKLVTNQPPPGVWVQTHQLNVVNFNNPKEPTVRKPASLPGELIGISHQGQILYTRSSRYADPVLWRDLRDWLDAGAYDGLNFSLVDSLPLPSWPRPAQVGSAHVLVGLPGDRSAGISPSVETWKMSLDGKFVREGAVSLQTSPQSFHQIGNLLAIRTENQVKLFDATNPAALAPSGVHQFTGCIGFNLEYSDGAVGRGLWVPLGPYGVTHVEWAR